MVQYPLMGDRWRVDIPGMEDHSEQSKTNLPASDARRIRRRRLMRIAAAAAVLSVVLAGSLFVLRWRDARSLRIDNQSGQILVLHANTDGLDWFTGEVEVAPRSSDTLRSWPLWKRPDSIYITEMFAIPQRQWSCRWEEVTAKGGLVWTEEGANCGEQRQ